MGPKECRHYLRSRNGRRDFQIDLAISLINYVISLDWEEGGERPDYIRRGSMSLAIVSVASVVSAGILALCGGWTIGHKEAEVRIPLSVWRAFGVRGMYVGMSAARCWLSKLRMCYRTQDPSIPSRDRDKLCKKSTMWCAQCKEPLCKQCRNKGYDKHQMKKVNN